MCFHLSDGGFYTFIDTIYMHFSYLLHALMLLYLDIEEYCPADGNGSIVDWLDSTGHLNMEIQFQILNLTAIT